MPKKKPKTKAKPSRWLLKSYIYLMLFIHGMMIMGVFLSLATDMQQGHVLMSSTLQIMFELILVLLFLDLYFLLYILRMRRWAFFAYCCSFLVIVFIMTYYAVATEGSSLAVALVYILPLLILSILVFMGGPRSAWRDMK